MNERVPLPIDTVENPPEGQVDDIPLTLTSSQATKAAFQSVSDTGAMLVARFLAKRELEEQGATKLTVEEANARFPGMRSPFREPVSPYVAQHLFDRDQEQRILEERVQAGPDDAWTKTKQFGAGVLAHMMDPIEFGVGAVAGWGVGAAIGRGLFGGKLAKTALQVSSRTATRAGRIAVSAAEAGAGGVIENTLQEAAVAGVTSEEGGEYDAVEGMKNIAVGTFFGLIPGVAIKEASHYLDMGLNRKAATQLRNTSPEADLMVVRNAVGNMVENKTPDPSRVFQALNKETDVTPEKFGNKFQYSYEKMTPEVSATPRKLYAVGLPEEGFYGAKKLEVGDGFGLGMQLTDNPGVANAASVRGLADSQQGVWTVQVDSLKPLDLNEPLPENLRGVFEARLREAGDDSPEVTLNELSPKETLEHLRSLVEDYDGPESALTGLRDDLRAAGYDSLVHDGARRQGTPHAQHNVIELLDEMKGRPEGWKNPDRTIVNKPTPEEQRLAFEDFQSLDRRWDMDAPRMRERMAAAESIDTSPKTVLGDVDGVHMELIEEFDSLDKQGLLDAGTRQELQKLKEIDAEIEAQDTLVKAASFCVGG